MIRYTCQRCGTVYDFRAVPTTAVPCMSCFEPMTRTHRRWVRDTFASDEVPKDLRGLDALMRTNRGVA